MALTEFYVGNCTLTAYFRLVILIGEVWPQQNGNFEAKPLLVIRVTNSEQWCSEELIFRERVCLAYCSTLLNEDDEKCDSACQSEYPTSEYHHALSRRQHR